MIRWVVNLLWIFEMFHGLKNDSVLCSAPGDQQVIRSKHVVQKKNVE